MKSRVFIMNQPTKFDERTGSVVPFMDFKPAEQFGELIFVLQDGELIGTPQAIVRELKEGLNDFGPDDFFLLAGDPRAMAWGSAIATQKAGGRIKMLHWVRSSRRYQIMPVDLRQEILA